MYRRSRFLIGLIASAVTFGSLMATMGPDHFNRAWHHRHYMENCWMHEKRSNDCCEQSEKQDHEKVIILREVIKNDTIKK